MTVSTLMSKPALMRHAQRVEAERDYWHRRYVTSLPPSPTPMADLREVIALLADLLDERPTP